jgi:hypothetical protein
MTSISELKTAIYEKLITSSSFRTNMNAVPVNITNATGTTTITITAAAHGHKKGDLVYIQNVLGMTDINGYRYVNSVTTNTFTIALSSATSQTYTSGGTSYRMSTFYVRALQGVAFPYCVFSFLTDNHTFDSGNEWEEIFIQFSLVDNDSSSGDINTLESNLIDLLDGYTFTFTNYTQISLTRLNKRHLIDGDNIWQTIIEYRIEMEKN